MATSGTYTYSQTVNDIVTAALRAAQVIGDEETPTGGQIQIGFNVMSALCAGWAVSQIHVWCEEELILFLQPGQILYQIGPGAVDHACLYSDAVITTAPGGAASGASSINVTSISGIGNGGQIGVQLSSGVNFWTTVSGVPSGTAVGLADPLPISAASGAFVFSYPGSSPFRPYKTMGARRYNYLSRLDVPIQMWARLDYQAQPNKMTPGVVTAFFYDPQIGKGAYSAPQSQMNVWPNPSDNTNALRFTAQRPIQDLGALAATPDFPNEWNQALMWNTSLELAVNYGCPEEQFQRIKGRAEYWFGMASAWDKESESIRFGVAMNSGYRRG